MTGEGGSEDCFVSWKHRIGWKCFVCCGVGGKVMWVNVRGDADSLIYSFLDVVCVSIAIYLSSCDLL